MKKVKRYQEALKQCNAMSRAFVELMDIYLTKDEVNRAFSKECCEVLGSIGRLRVAIVKAFLKESREV